MDVLDALRAQLLGGRTGCDLMKRWFDALLAQMCVKTKRLDVAEICLGNMGHARGARAVRDAVAQHTSADGVLREPDVCAAMVAIQLDMLDDAKQLYASCGRHDLLNNLYQASGQWEQALKLAEEKDRIHLKATHYTYAKQLEASGNTAEAMRHFEKSGTHRAEVPRMLFDAQQMAQLQAYIDSSQDKELLKYEPCSPCSCEPCERVGSLFSE